MYTVSAISNGVLVQVETFFLPQHSRPEDDQYMFAYRIRITNRSEFTLKLVSRTWIITDALGVKRRVDGTGVVGYQPVLSPGEHFEYTSGCDFTTPLGRMHGYYTMRKESEGSSMRIAIPPFVMAYPPSLN